MYCSMFFLVKFRFLGMLKITVMIHVFLYQLSLTSIQYSILYFVYGDKMMYTCFINTVFRIIMRYLHMHVFQDHYAILTFTYACFSGSVHLILLCLLGGLKKFVFLEITFPILILCTCILISNF